MKILRIILVMALQLSICVGLLSQKTTVINMIHIDADGNISEVPISIYDDSSFFPSADGDMIFNNNKQEMIAVDHDAEEYSVFNEESINQLKGQLDQSAQESNKMLDKLPAGLRKKIEEAQKSQGSKPSFMPGKPDKRYVLTNDTKLIDGLMCRKYEVFVGDQLVEELWVTAWTNIKDYAIIQSAFEAIDRFMDKIRAVSQREFGTPMSSNSIGDIFKEIDGFPVHTKDLENNEVRKYNGIEHQPYDPGMLTPPKGYRLRTMRSR